MTVEQATVSWPTAMRYGERVKCPECWNPVRCEDVVVLGDNLRYGCSECGQGHRLGFGLEKLPAGAEQRVPTDFVELLELVVAAAGRLDREKWQPADRVFCKPYRGKMEVSLGGVLLAHLGWPSGIPAHFPALLKPGRIASAATALEAFQRFGWDALDDWLSPAEIADFDERFAFKHEEYGSWGGFDSTTLRRATLTASLLRDRRRAE